MSVDTCSHLILLICVLKCFVKYKEERVEEERILDQLLDTGFKQAVAEIEAVEATQLYEEEPPVKKQETGAMSMVFNIRQSFRWIPSEHNPSDAPSRLYENDTDAAHAGTDKIQFSYSNFGPVLSAASEPLDVTSTCSSEGHFGATASGATAPGGSEGEDSAAGGPDVFDIASECGEDALSPGFVEDSDWSEQGGDGDFDYIHPGLRQMLRPAEDR